MVKVLKRMPLPSEQLIKTTCRNCRSELEFARGEARREYDRYGNSLVIECPVCFAECWVATPRP